jgi:CBS domain-containing protein
VFFMNLSELCQRDILTLSAEASVQKAAELMLTQHVGALALTDPKDPVRVVGVVTDRDLVVNVLAQGRTPDEQKVGAYSSVHLVRVPGKSTVHEAVKAMHRHGVRRVFVTEDDGRLMGLMSIDDLLAALADDLSGLSEALRFGIDMESARTSPIFRPDELPMQLYLAQHEP